MSLGPIDIRPLDVDVGGPSKDLTAAAALRFASCDQDTDGAAGRIQAAAGAEENGGGHRPGPSFGVWLEVPDCGGLGLWSPLWFLVWCWVRATLWTRCL